jgi:hypothetical protein
MIRPPPLSSLWFAWCRGRNAVAAVVVVGEQRFSFAPEKRERERRGKEEDDVRQG